MAGKVNGPIGSKSKQKEKEKTLECFGMERETEKERRMEKIMRIFKEEIVADEGIFGDIYGEYKKRNTRGKRKERKGMERGEEDIS